MADCHPDGRSVQGNAENIHFAGKFTRKYGDFVRDGLLSLLLNCAKPTHSVWA
jgi:hypothetical protein